MENNNFCDNQCWKCLGYEMCRKSFKKKDRYKDEEAKSNENVLTIEDESDDDLEWWQK